MFPFYYHSRKFARLILKKESNKLQFFFFFTSHLLLSIDHLRGLNFHEKLSRRPAQLERRNSSIARDKIRASLSGWELNYANSQLSHPVHSAIPKFSMITSLRSAYNLGFSSFRGRKERLVSDPGWIPLRVFKLFLRLVL